MDCNGFLNIGNKRFKSLKNQFSWLDGSRKSIVYAWCFANLIHKTVKRERSIYSLVWQGSYFDGFLGKRHKTFMKTFLSCYRGTHAQVCA